MEWYDRLDCGGKNTIKICIIAVLFCICAFVLCGCTSCRGAANATPTQDREAIMALEYKNKLYDDMLRAYNHLVHRVWVDHPTYVEEVLTESDEYAELDDLLGGQWEDTFQFYNEEDSIAYHLNWDSTDGTVRIVRHVVEIPQHTQARLKEVFGDE